MRLEWQLGDRLLLQHFGLALGLGLLFQLERVSYSGVSLSEGLARMTGA